VLRGFDMFSGCSVGFMCVWCFSALKVLCAWSRDCSGEYALVCGQCADHECRIQYDTRLGGRSHHRQQARGLVRSNVNRILGQADRI
jgi:hypothetical protein